MNKLRTLGKLFIREIAVYRLVISDHRIPRLAKFLLGFTIFYAFLPFDIIPDFIPVLGQLEDAIILPILVIIALQLIPKEVLEDCRKKPSIPNTSNELVDSVGGVLKT